MWLVLKQMKLKEKDEDLKKYPESDWIFIYHHCKEDFRSKDVDTSRKPSLERDLKFVVKIMRDVAYLRKLRRVICFIAGDGHSYSQLCPEGLTEILSSGMIHFLLQIWVFLSE